MLAIKPFLSMRPALLCLLWLLMAGLNEARSETANLKEKWVNVNGFKVGYACNLTLANPGQGHALSLQNFRDSDIVESQGRIEFRGIKPKSPYHSSDSLIGSNFTVFAEGNLERLREIGIAIYGTRKGRCNLLISANDGSETELLRGSQAPEAPLSSRTARRVESEIRRCREELAKSADPESLFYCTSPFPYPEGEQLPSEGPIAGIGPEGVVPAYLIRLYLRSRGQVFAFTDFNGFFEIELLEK